MLVEFTSLKLFYLFRANIKLLLQWKMDCRIIDNKDVLRDGHAVSVPPNHSDDTEQIER